MSVSGSQNHNLIYQIDMKAMIYILLCSRTSEDLLISICPCTVLLFELLQDLRVAKKNLRGSIPD